MDSKLEYIKRLVETITAKCFLVIFEFKVSYDDKYTRMIDIIEGQPDGRIYIQVLYSTVCNKTNYLKEWKGRKFYLSDHMTDDEIIKTCYFAFKTAIEHEIMEGFTVEDKILFNPHTNYKSLLKVSNDEIRREPN